MKLTNILRGKKRKIDPANKGNQKLYLPVKNKTKSTNWKTKLKQGANWGIKQCK